MAVQQAPPSRRSSRRAPHLPLSCYRTRSACTRAGGKGGLRAAFSCPKRVKTTAKTGSVPICHPPILNWALAISTRENGRDSGFIRITPKSAVFGFGNCCRWLCGAVNFCMVCHLWSYRAEPCHRRRMIRIITAGQSSKEDPPKTAVSEGLSKLSFPKVSSGLALPATVCSVMRRRE